MPGRNQESVLLLMASHDGRYPWQIDSPRRVVLDSLIRRGHVEFVDEWYSLTAQGKAMVADIKRRKGLR